MGLTKPLYRVLGSGFPVQVPAGGANTRTRRPGENGFVLALLLLLAWRSALPGYQFQFPRDHFEHPGFRTEWWYYTGNVSTAAGRRFGFELVFFRQAQPREPAENPSVWRVDDLYLAHTALTDVDGGRFRYYKRLNRAGPGIAGVSFEQRRVWNGNWSVQWEEERQTLTAVTGEFRFTLQLTPVKPLVINGENGVSKKGAEPGKASHYVSFPRLAAEGEINGERVSGTAWMDHEWFTDQLETDQVGWNWFSAQLADGTELMLLGLRRRQGGVDPYSLGTFVDRQGHARHLKASDFALQPLAYWTSPATKARYPVRWKIAVPSLGILLECRAALENQELGSTPNYWEGAVTYSGSATGVGYLEMTGYDKPMKL